MAKEVAGLIKLQIRGGAANPAPPVGPALGAKGVNIMEFCKQFNARTQDKPGKVVPVVITVYSDKSFDFVLKTPPAAVQIMEHTYGHDSPLYRFHLRVVVGRSADPAGYQRLGQHCARPQRCLLYTSPSPRD